MGLFEKWGVKTPYHLVISDISQLDNLIEANKWMHDRKMVVKAHEAIGGRMKRGLVKIDLDVAGVKKAAKEIIGKDVDGLEISQVIIAEMIPHEEEYYIAIQSTRDGAEVLLAKMGGIDVEENWEKVKKSFVEVGAKPTKDQLAKLAKEAGFTGGLVDKVVAFAEKFFDCYDNEDGQYIEINPLIVNPKNDELTALDAVTNLDGDARFRHPDWNFNFAAEFGREYTPSEKAIMEIDSKVKGSVKLIEIPGGTTALLPAGGGASVFYSDAVVTLGGTIANYSEYSGDPPAWAVEALTVEVCALPGIKNIIVGGAIANFTDVKVTFAGIIAGFRKSKNDGLLKGVKIWVRRGGPNEAAGLAAMRELKNEGFDIEVFDRYTPLTDIVNMALGK
jgi:ATP-citrate lyase beta-subunit